jgi:hypothetical protein
VCRQQGEGQRGSELPYLSELPFLTSPTVDSPNLPRRREFAWFEERLWGGGRT